MEKLIRVINISVVCLETMLEIIFLMSFQSHHHMTLNGFK